MINSRQEKTGKKVLVGLTGRVASTVTAFLLKKQGFDVIGMSIVTNVDENFPGSEYFPKCHVTDLEGIRAFCEKLNIPYYATNSVNQFEYEVMDPLVGGRLSGLANISCFNCTRTRIQIMIDKMHKLGADYIATGHFCKIHKNLNRDEYYIHASGHSESDQSHLLAGMKNEFLKHLMLPLGDLSLEEVRKIANQFQLECIEKYKDGHFCFDDVPSYLDYIEKSVPSQLKTSGAVLNMDTEINQGEHKGIINYQMTQTGLTFKGLPPNDTKMMVVDYKYSDATLMIGTKEHLSYEGVQIVDLTMNLGIDTKKPITCFFKTKYSKRVQKCALYFKNNRSAYCDFGEKVYPVIKGEMLIFYDREGRNAKVIGRGQIYTRGSHEIVDRAYEFKTQEERDEPRPHLKF